MGGVGEAEMTGRLKCHRLCRFASNMPLFVITVCNYAHATTLCIFMYTNQGGL